MVRGKTLLLGGIAVAGALVLLGGSRDWITFLLQGSHSVEAITGHQVNAALSPIAIAIVVAALALTIAGAVFRRVLGILVALLGGGGIAIASGAVVAPLASAAGRVTELTGIVQGPGDAELVWVQVSAWAWVTIVAGVAAMLFGLAVTLFSGSWGAAGRRYGSQAESAKAEQRGDRISDWDALSQGEDPSEYFR